MSRVEVKNISKSFPQGDEERPVLRLVNLTVEAGESIAITGKSGSGKTTLLDVIGGILLPDEGSVLVEGENLAALSEPRRTVFRRKHIGMVFQFFNLIPTLTARENVCFPLHLNGHSDLSRADELLDELGMTSRANAFPDSLSGGEQQRIAIARALVHSPELVLADEPTGNLDHDHSITVLDAFQGLCKEEDVTLILGTHSETCASYSDRILELRQGTLSNRNENNEEKE